MFARSGKRRQRERRKASAPEADGLRPVGANLFCCARPRRLPIFPASGGGKGVTVRGMVGAPFGAPPPLLYCRKPAFSMGFGQWLRRSRFVLSLVNKTWARIVSRERFCLSAPARSAGRGTMPTGPARSGRPDDRLRMVEGPCSKEAHLIARARSTTLLRSVVPLPRFADQDEEAFTPTLSRRRERDWAVRRGDLLLTFRRGSGKELSTRGRIVSRAFRDPGLSGKHRGRAQQTIIRGGLESLYFSGAH